MCFFHMKSNSDIPRDRCCLNQSAKRISGPDITIRPAHSVVCRMRAITLSYAGNKQCLGPCTTGLLPAYDYDGTHAVHPVRKTSCSCMPYCTTESFASGLGA